MQCKMENMRKKRRAIKTNQINEQNNNNNKNTEVRKRNSNCGINATNN